MQDNDKKKNARLHSEPFSYKILPAHCQATDSSARVFATALHASEGLRPVSMHKVRPFDDRRDEQEFTALFDGVVALPNAFFREQATGVRANLNWYWIVCLNFVYLTLNPNHLFHFHYSTIEVTYALIWFSSLIIKVNIKDKGRW